MSLLPRLVSPLAGLIWPRTCAACGGSLGGQPETLCPRCRTRLEQLAAVPYCPRCGRSASPLAIDPTGCPGCRRERFWNHRGLVRIGPYESPLRDWLLAIKFGRNPRALRRLAALLADRLRAAPWFGQIDFVVPVPMHWIRRLDRPWDHARVLACEVAARIDRPIIRVLRRRVYTPSFVGTASTRAQRFRLIRGSFAPRLSRRLRGAGVCVIDNVVVTGATLHEVCRTLRHAGASRVYAAIACRQAGNGDWNPDTECLLAPPVGKV